MLNSTFPTKRYDNDRMVCILPRPIIPRILLYYFYALRLSETYLAPHNSKL